MGGLDVINILDGLDGCPSDGMDWMLDGLLTTLLVNQLFRSTADSPSHCAWDRSQPKVVADVISFSLGDCKKLG